MTFFKSARVCSAGRKSNPLLPAAILAIAAFSGSNANAQALVQSEPIDSIVALVEENVILRSELDLAMAGILDRIRAAGEQMPPRDLLEKQVLERLITRELQVQRALMTGIRINDSEIDQMLVNLAQQNGITVQQMRQLLEQDGEDFSEFRRNLGEELLTERLRQRIVANMPPISDTEVDILLASEEIGGGEYNISHIMVGLPEGATPQQITEARDKARDIHRRLTEGLDFASAAISYSDSQEALEGGEVGWRDLNSVPAFFADAVKDLKPGEFTEPVRSPAGYHIVKVNDYRERGKLLLEEFNARHIMVEVNEIVTPRDAMDEITVIRQKLEDGEDFGELAREYSDDPSSANIGGEMGWFPPDAYGDRVKLTLEGLEVGEISEPFQSSSGWHIIQLLDKREVDRTEDAIRAEACETIRQRKAEQEIERTLRQWRDESFVEIRLPGAENSG